MNKNLPPPPAPAAAAAYEPVQKHKVTPGIPGWLNYKHTIPFLQNSRYIINQNIHMYRTSWYMYLSGKVHTTHNMKHAFKLQPTTLVTCNSRNINKMLKVKTKFLNQFVKTHKRVTCNFLYNTCMTKFKIKRFSIIKIYIYTIFIIKIYDQ